MRTRSALLGFIFAIALTVAAIPSARAADPGTFEVMGLRTGMTLAEVQRAVEQQDLGTPKLVRAPSFEQEVALARKERVAATDYKGVQTLRAGNGDRRVQVFFVATPKGPVSTKITIEVFEAVNIEKLSERLITKYGPPKKKTSQEWLWGDTGMFYARAEPYLEFQPEPVSARRPRSIGRLILADPTLQKRSREAIANEVAKKR